MNINIRDWLDLSTEKLFWVLLFCTLVLGLPFLIPDKAFAELGLLRFQEMYRPWLSGALLFVFAGLVTTGAKVSFKWGINHRRERQTLKWRGTRLRYLAPRERSVLHPFFVTNRRNLYLVSDGTIDDLIDDGILLPASSYLGFNRPEGHMLDYEISRWAWEFLKVHPELISTEMDAPYEVPGHP